MFQYYSATSFVHRMNALVKLACAAALIFVSTLSLAALPSLVFAAISFIVALVFAQIPSEKFVRTLFPYLALALGFFWFYAVLTPNASDAPLVQVGPVRVTSASLNMALAIALRITTIMSLTVTFMMTTTPTDFILSLVHQARLNQRVAFGMFAAIRFMPIAESEMLKIRQAHRIRGVGERAGVGGTLRRFRRYAIPLLSSVIRTALRTALAMDLKAFAVYDTRTYMRVTRVSRTEIVAAFVFVGILLALTVAMVQLGIWGGFSFNLHGQPGR